MEGRDEFSNNHDKKQPQQQDEQQQEQQVSQELHSSQTTANVIKGKRTKRQRPQSPIPFRVISGPYNDIDNDNNLSATRSGEGSDICSNNQENNNNDSANNVVVEMTTPNVVTIMSTGVSDDEDCHHTTTAATTTTTTTASTEEEEDMANCLILLAQGQPYNPPQKLPVTVAVAELDQQHDHVTANHNNYNLPAKFTSRKFMDAPKSSGGGYYVYECKTCSKTFPSFQALGGHRASHKKPKIKEDDKFERIRNSYSFIGNLKPNLNNNNNNNNMVLSSDEEIDPPFKNNKIASSSSPSLSLQLTNRAIYSSSSNQHSKPRVHECSICGAEFASGQALGGHMRRHRNPAPGHSGVSLAVGPPARSTSTDQSKLSLDLDLNLPAPSEDNTVVDHNQRESKFVFASKQPQPQTQMQQHQQQPSQPQQNQQQQQLVFSSTALVDCHY